MENNYYPWNVQVLVDWLKQELAHYKNLPILSHQLKIPTYELQRWFTSSMPHLTLHHIRAIAAYRGLAMQEIIHWLDLKPAHIKELIAKENTAQKIELDDSETVVLTFLEP